MIPGTAYRELAGAAIFSRNFISLTLWPENRDCGLGFQHVAIQKQNKTKKHDSMHLVNVNIDTEERCSQI